MEFVLLVLIIVVLVFNLFVYNAKMVFILKTMIVFNVQTIAKIAVNLIFVLIVYQDII